MKMCNYCKKEIKGTKVWEMGKTYHYACIEPCFGITITNPL